MSWPASQDYNEAIQDPRSSFADPELRGGEAVANALGVPMPRSGNFADVYEFNCPASNTKWALKCFTRPVASLRERYGDISQYLQAVRLPFMVGFQFLQQGIRIQGRWYPILKMRWVEGLLLNEFVRANLDRPALLGQLGVIWGRMGKRLREAGIAHCDLQHGNVILVPGSKTTSLAVKLIDYDGMFIPALAQTRSGEVGHPNYQHPQRLREGTYNLEVDRFPLLVVATALQALSAAGRPLWERSDNGDNLLFKECDLRKPAESPLFHELLSLPDPRTHVMVTALLRACQVNLEVTPHLEDVSPLPNPSVAPPLPASPILVASAVDVPVAPPVESHGPDSEWDLNANEPVAREREPKPQRGLSKWVWQANGVAVVVLLVLLFLAIGGGSKPSNPPVSSKGIKKPDPKGTTATRPAVEDRVIDTPEQRERIDRAIERGLAFLRENQQEDGGWPSEPIHQVGKAALPGLTLLECGVAGSTPEVQKAAALVRSASVKVAQTYDLALAILFLDRLGKTSDEPLIQTFALRLISGQTYSGGWTYPCPVLSRDEELKLLAALKQTRPGALSELFPGGPDARRPDLNQPGAATGEHGKILTSLPLQLRGIPALPQIRTVGQPPGRPPDNSDNSNTQFAMLGLWAAGRHGVPVERALALTVTRFRTSQAADGGWHYKLTGPPATPAGMTAAGLLGLATGHGLVASRITTDPEHATGVRRLADRVLSSGLNALARHLGPPTPPRKGQPVNLYFLWAMERVAVIYNLAQIDGKDWYHPRADQLMELQTEQGNWSIPGGYVGATPIVDTSMALLFLKRANFAKDLSRKIQDLGAVEGAER